MSQLIYQIYGINIINTSTFIVLILIFICMKLPTDFAGF